MDRLLISACIVLMLGTLHYSYLDFRARLRGGVMWFWTAWDKPMLHRLSNTAALAAFCVALASFFVGTKEALIVIMGALFTIHVITLELVWNRQA
jgi:hypothetical protein